MLNCFLSLFVSVQVSDACLVNGIFNVGGKQVDNMYRITRWHTEIPGGKKMYCEKCACLVYWQRMNLVSAGVVLGYERTCMLFVKYWSLYLCEHIILDMAEVQICEAVLYMCYFICAIW